MECGSILNPLFSLSLCRSPGTGEIKSPKWCSSLFQRQSRPRMEGGADQLCSLASVFLLTVPEAVSSHNEGRSKSAVKSNFCVAPRCPRGSLVPYISKENQFLPGPIIAGPGSLMFQASRSYEEIGKLRVRNFAN